MSDTRLFQRWDELSSLVDRAHGLTGDALESFCAEACGDDAELLSLLRRMLRDTTETDEKVHAAISQAAKDASGDDSLIGRRVGAYTLVEELGVGGMGAVYLATRADGEFDKKVAVKVVRRRMPSDASAVMFRNERQALANLHHPCIPTLVDSGELEDGRPYFICDFINGITIDEYCKTKQLPVGKVLDVFERVAAAVQHAHTNLILHLDIKPNNVLVQPDGTPSLLDFGVARAMGDDSTTTRAYSPSYASPEQILGARLTAASDVYSLGALLYCLLSGERPFTVDREAPTNTVFAKRAEFVDRLQKDFQLGGIDADLTAIVRKAMSEQPSERYATVDALLNDVRRYRTLQPVLARAGGTAYQVGKFVRRHRLAIALASLAVVTLASFTWRESDLRRQAEKASDEAAREAETARQVSTFMVNVFSVSDPSRTRGSSVTARELLDRAALTVDMDLAEQPYVAADLKHTMGKAYVGLGLYDEAVPMLEQALSLSESTGDTSSLNHAEILYSLGKQYDAIARHQDAIAALSRSLTLQQSSPQAQPERVIATHTAISRLHRILSNFEQAEASLTEAARIAKQTVGHDDASYSETMLEFAGLYYDTGRFHDSLEAAELAVQLRRSDDADDLGLADALAWLATAQKDVGEYDNAHSSLQEALNQLDAIVAPDHPDIGGIHYLISIVYLMQGELVAAEAAIQEAIAIQEKALGETHPAVGLSVSVLGEIYQEQGNYREAEGPMQRALDIMRANHPEEHRNVSFEKFMLGGLYLHLGELETAERFVDEALTHYSAVDPASDHNAIYAGWLKADLLVAQNRVSEAADLYAELFEICTRLDNLQEEQIEEFSTNYAAFLASQGKPVAVEELEARLR